MHIPQNPDPPRLYAPTAVANAWNDIDRDPHAIFDGYSKSWRSLAPKTRLSTIKTFADYFYLDPMLVNYIRSGRQHDPGRFAGLGQAIVDYAEMGFHMRLPASPLIGPIQSPGYVASLSRLLEDSQLDCTHGEWLVLEIRRLQRAADAWLRLHTGQQPEI